MKITIAKALRNYHEDLRYSGHYWDRENLNCFTSGTPEFQSDAHMNAYIDAIASLLAEQEDEDDLVIECDKCGTPTDQFAAPTHCLMKSWCPDCLSKEDADA